MTKRIDKAQQKETTSPRDDRHADSTIDARSREPRSDGALPSFVLTKLI
jgi:hypothetical protein